MVQQADKQLAQSDCYVSVKCLKCKWKCQNATENVFLKTTLFFYWECMYIGCLIYM